VLIELTISIGEQHAEALADALLEAGAASVAIEDAQAETDDEQALFGEPGGEPERLAWHLSRLRILASPDLADTLVFDAATELGIAAPAIERRIEIADSDWVRTTQAQFPPIPIGRRLWIVPSWHEAPDPDALVIRLDPGVAFGTGTHATTRLCLAWLDEHEVRSARVLDYGCGSGILAIAAARFGAGEVVGTDIDPQALLAARANSEANGIVARYTEPAALAAGTFDIVLANILSNPLKLLAPALLARVVPGGALVLSGVLERQAEEVIATYASTGSGIRLSSWRCEDGWVCLAGRRTG